VPRTDPEVPARVPRAGLGAFIQGGRGPPRAEHALAAVRGEFSLAARPDDLRVFRAITACRLGALPEDVARFLDWRDFESFCATILRAADYTVTENLLLRNPRLQIDILARSPSIALVVDCKHWARERGPSTMGRVAAAQAQRALRLRAKMSHLEPMAVVVLALSNEQARFVGGAAVVPIGVLGGFLRDLPSFVQELSLY
jgi:Restriction endonuclease